MTKILVIHGAGMNMRGKAQTEIFGKMTLPEYDVHIRDYAKELGVDVEIFHSNIEGEVINKLFAAHDAGIDGAIINPDGYTRGYPALVGAIGKVGFPVIEIHISGGADSDPRWLGGKSLRLDSHDTAVPEPVWGLLQSVLPRCPKLRGVTLERMEGTVESTDVIGLQEELTRLREMVSPG